jgi:Extracellular link domain
MANGASIVWILVTIVILTFLFYTKAFQHAEKYANEHESFNNAGHLIPGDAGVEAGQQRFNDLMAMINIANPSIPLTAPSAVQIDQATNTPITSGGESGQFQINSVSNPYKIPTNVPDTMRKAQTICEKVKSPDCSAFQNADFAANCGISFDMDGINSKGEGHIGGLYISPDDRTNQLQRAERLGLRPNQIEYVPSIGKSKKGMFAINKQSCPVLSEQLACKRTHAIGVGNCTHCYTSSEFNRVDPSTPRIKPQFNFVTNATQFYVYFGNGWINYPAKSGVTTAAFDNSKEGNTFYIYAMGDAATLDVAGYISADTARGTFKMDLKTLIDRDVSTGYKPRLAGTKDVNGVRCFVMRPALGSSLLFMLGVIPYTFLTPNEFDAQNCDNGPIITTQAGADIIASDPCYGPTNKPGSYSLACIQQLFISMGGTSQGTGYPNDNTKARAILFNGDQPRSLVEIGNYLYDINVRASTGRDNGGNTLSIADWNSASMFCTSTPISSPCDGPTKNTGPLTKDCMQYLYTNGGLGKPNGATYTLGQQQTSMAATGGTTQYCTPKGKLSPATPEGEARARAAGGMNAVKSMYDNAHRLANDNTKKNADRAAAVMDCYGDKLQRPNQEVFWVGPGYDYTKAQAQGVCAQYGARVATQSELQNAQRGGADWCATGWVSDSDIAQYPITTRTMGGCGNGSPGIKQYNPGSAGVNCYGSKPEKADVGGKIQPFNETNWNNPKVTFIEEKDTDNPGFDIQCLTDGSPVSKCKEQCMNDTRCKGVVHVPPYTVWGGQSGCCTKYDATKTKGRYPGLTFFTKTS